jgi:formate hydrogenlyase transcriptional activator
VFPKGAPYLGVAMQRYNILLDVADVVCSRQQPPELFRDLLPRLRSTLPCDLLTFALHNPSRNTMQVHLRSGAEPWPDSSEEIAVDHSAVGWVWRNQEALSVDDVKEYPRFDPGLRPLGERGMRSYCVVPLSTSQRKLGALGIASKRVNAYNVSDEQFLVQVAKLVALSLDETQSDDALCNERERLRVLRDATSLQARPSNEQPPDPGEPSVKVSHGPTLAGRDIKPETISHREPARLIPFISSEDNSGLDLLVEYFTSSTVGLCVVSSDLRYLAINNRLARINGVPPEDHLGKTIFEVLGDAAAKVESAVKTVLATGKPVLNFELAGTVPTAAAPGRRLETYFPIRDEHGEMTRIGVTVMEVTELGKADDAVRRLTDQLQEEQNRLQVLREMGVVLSRQLDLKELFAATANCLEKAIPFDLAGIWLYSAEDQTMRMAAIDSRVGEVFREGESLPVSECMLGQSMLAGKLGAVSEEQLKALPFSSAERILQHGLKSVCSVPLITPKGPLGALGLGCRDDRAFSPEDLALLRDAAGSIALALEIALARQSLQSDKDRLQALSEISNALSRSKADFQQVFPVVSACIQKIVHYDMVAVGVFNRSAGTVRGYTLDRKLKQSVFSDNVTLPLQHSIVDRLVEDPSVRTFTRGQLEAHARELPKLQRALDEGLQSLCSVPLVTSRGILGALLLGHRDARHFPEQDLDFLNRLAPEVALSLESAIAHEALEREKERLGALREIDALLVANADPDILLPKVSDSLRRAVPHDQIGIHIYDEKARVLRDQVALTEMTGKIIHTGVLPLDASVAGEVFMERKARILDYEELAGLPYPVAKRAIAHGLRSLCFIPLITAKGASGVLVLASVKDHAFTNQDLDFLGQVAAALAQAVQNKSSHRALQEEKKRLQVLLNVSSLLTSNWNVQETFATISSYLRRVLRHECAFFSLYDRENNVFVRQAQDFPLGKGLLAAATPVFCGGPHWLAVAEQRPVIFSQDDVESFRSEAPLAEWANGFLAEGLKSMCCIPLLRPKGPLGTLTLASTRAEAFAVTDTDLLNQVAAQLATTLENAGISREVDELNRRITEEKRYLQGEPGIGGIFEGIIGDSPGLHQVLEQVATVAGTEATTLILGETGTGKELVARAIHQTSGRRDRAFIKVNCAAIPSGLLESELFGHEKGAFTGAIHQKIGRMELADRGTLFLDEVGEIPLELQPKLLRVLQDHEFERLGGLRTIKVDLRIVAATNRVLSDSVARGDFRSDLFYRLNVFPIRMPALRERRQDIPALVQHFVQKFAAQMNRKIESVPRETMQALINYPWPGNVRELENLVERSVILSKRSTLRVPLAELVVESQAGKAADTLENAEREHILRVLRDSHGVISGPKGAAHKLGLKRTTLQSKMQRLGISRQDY